MGLRVQVAGVGAEPMGDDKGLRVEACLWRRQRRDGLARRSWECRAVITGIWGKTGMDFCQCLLGPHVD